MNKLKILIILGSSREGRRGDKVSNSVMKIIPEIKKAEFEFIDLRDWKLPFYNLATYPSDKPGVYGSKIQEKWAKKIGSADGFIFITPEYNHGYSAILKNAIDFLWYEWNHKPVAFISYGNVTGGVRAVEQLRQVLVEVEAVTIRESVIIPRIKDAVKNGELENEDFKRHVLEMAERLLIWAKHLKEARKELAY